MLTFGRISPYRIPNPDSQGNSGSQRGQNPIADRVEESRAFAQEAADAAQRLNQEPQNEDGPAAIAREAQRIADAVLSSLEALQTQERTLIEASRASEQRAGQSNQPRPESPSRHSGPRFGADRTLSH
ncbi:MAG: hypothetical protein AAGI66_03450 [Cyanobacteria bacterium P01_H01_bin.74]